MPLCKTGKQLRDLLHVQAAYERPAYGRTKRRLLKHIDDGCADCAAARAAAIIAAKKRIRTGYPTRRRAAENS